MAYRDDQGRKQAPGFRPKPKAKPKPKRLTFKTPASEVKDTKGASDVKRAEPTVRRELKRIRRKYSEVKDTKGNADRNRASDYRVKQVGSKPLPGTTKAEVREALKRGYISKVQELPTKAERARRQAVITAPAVKVLDQTLRPVRASAGAADALVQGKGVSAALKGAERGLIHNKGPTYSTVLKHAGVKNKTVRAIGGFIGDVALDPTTYATFGASAPARKLAESAARNATKDALKQGATKAVADKAGRAAAKKALSSGKSANKGLQVGVRVANRQASTSGRTTSFVLRKTGASKVATKVRETTAVQGMGKSFVHDFRPKTRTPKQHEAMRAAGREHRARTGADARAIERRYGHALRKAVKSPDEQRQVIDAIEAGAVHELPDKLRNAANTIQGDLERMHEGARKRGISRGRFRTSGPTDAQGYIPHVNALAMEGGKAASGGKIRVSADQARKIREPLATLRANGDKTFTEDLPRIMASKANKEAGRASLHDFWQKVAKHGRPVKAGDQLELSHGELVYKVQSDGLSPVAKENAAGHLASDKQEVAAILSGRRQGRYVVLHNTDVEDLKGRLRGGAPNEDEALRAYDKAQGFLKTVYTVPNPAYHLRNLYGDSFNAYLGDATIKGFKDAAAVLETRVVKHRAERSGKQFTGDAAAPKRLSKTVKVRGKRVTHEQLLKEAEQHGAISQGFIGRELTDLRGKQGPIARASQYREDLPRLATYISARRRGMTPSQASEWVSKHHFDYGDLTSFERKVARRVIPFYTFFARNTRLQTTKVFTRPGKATTLAKVLDETSKALGFSSYDEYAKNLKDYEQRGLPIPLPGPNGKVFNYFLALPATDLNQLATSPGDQIQGIANRVTFFKTIGELALNYSVFFQGKIQDDQHPLTRAPDAVGELPGFLRKKLGITNDWIDPKTGKKAWAWPSKVDYTVRALPEGNFALQQLLPERGSRNQSPGDSRLAFATGIKRTPYATDSRSLSQVKQQVNDLDKKLARLRDSGKAEDSKLKGHYTREYQRILDQRKALMDKRYGFEKKLGMPDAKARRLKRRPLTDEQKFDQKINDFLNKDPEKDLEDKLDKFLSASGG